MYLYMYIYICINKVLFINYLALAIDPFLDSIAIDPFMGRARPRPMC